MHHCLHISEIVELIACFAEDRFSALNPSVALALTCRTLYEPASNIRWRSLQSLDPLLRLFPANRSTAGKKAVRQVSLEKSLGVADPADWTRFLHHAHWVRNLACRWSWPSIAYLKVLHRFRPDGVSTLLPSLQKLDCIVAEVAADSIFPIRALVHPGLRSLHVIYETTDRLFPALDFLHERYPTLQTVEISYGATPQALLSTAPLLLSLSSIRHLNALTYTAGPLPSDIMSHLAELPMLESLNTETSTSSSSHLLLSSLKGSRIFPKLRHLWLRSSVAKGITDFLDSLSSRQLETVVLYTAEQPTSATVTRWNKLLAQQLHLSEIAIRLRQSISMETSMLKVSQASGYIINDETFRPLLTLPRLSNLCLSDFPLQITNQLVQDMAVSWACLEVLILGTSVRCPTSGVTLEGLTPLAEHCQKLFILGLPLTTPPPDEVPAKSTPRRWRWRLKGLRRARPAIQSTTDTNSSAAEVSPSIVHDLPPANANRAIARRASLVMLDVGCSVIANPASVASFISEHFPNVQDISDTADVWRLHKDGQLKQRLEVNGLLQKYVNDRARDKALREHDYPTLVFYGSVLCDIKGTNSDTSWTITFNKKLY